MNYICYLTYFSILIGFKYYTISFFISEAEIEKLVRSGLLVWESGRQRGTSFGRKAMCFSTFVPGRKMWILPSAKDMGGKMV